MEERCSSSSAKEESRLQTCRVVGGDGAKGREEGGWEGRVERERGCAAAGLGAPDRPRPLHPRVRR